MRSIQELLEISSAHHHHACPRQVLGVRMGMCAADILGLDLPQADKRLYTFMESDGCIVDGVSVATGCWVGRRTLQVIDFGKMAATFVDTHTGQAIRVIPHPEARRRVKLYAPRAESDWLAYMDAYQIMPATELLVAQPVCLVLNMQAIIGGESLRATCQRCGEEIFNGREVRQHGQVLCRACAGDVYYEHSTYYGHWQIRQWQDYPAGKAGA